MDHLLAFAPGQHWISATDAKNNWSFENGKAWRRPALCRRWFQHLEKVQKQRQEMTEFLRQGLAKKLMLVLNSCCPDWNLHTMPNKNDDSGHLAFVPDCLGQCSVAVKKHHDQGNSYKRKHLLEGLLTVSEDESIITTAGCRQA
ncbi:hypothetical protein STEG23_000580, partial [Scotinomys teguina]